MCTNRNALMPTDVKETWVALCCFVFFFLICFKSHALPLLLIATRNNFLLGFDESCSGTTVHLWVYSAKVLISNTNVLKVRGNILRFRIKQRLWSLYYSCWVINKNTLRCSDLFNAKILQPNYLTFVFVAHLHINFRNVTYPRYSL